MVLELYRHVGLLVDIVGQGAKDGVPGTEHIRKG